MLKTFNARRELFICLVLAVVSLAVFWQVTQHEFIDYDDPSYVTENSHVQAGLTVEGLKWAFTTSHVGNWHPLTWLSHMLDCQLFGLKPGWHHGMNLLFHIANTLLLFLVLRRMTKKLWPSAFVAALFALHPLHVESVAWVAERKDVLSTFFWMLTMGAYVYYVERPGYQRYLTVLVFFILGLMAKPMLVTLPFVLLLLDYWPLGRLQPKRFDAERTTAIKPESIRRKKRKAEKTIPGNITRTGGSAEPVLQWSTIRPLIWEKAPFFVFSAVSSVITFYVQQQAGAMSSLKATPFDARVANAFVSYVSYIGKMIWPQNLAVFYPHPGTFPLWQIIGAILLVLLVVFSIIWMAKRSPYLVVGWFWYLGTLIPVIGLVHVGKQAMADRYTYVPLIGLFIMIAWGIPDLIKKRPWKKLFLSVSAAGILLILMYGSWLQLKYWQNSTSLFQHAIERTKNNAVGHYMMGIALSKRGKVEEGMYYYDTALRINPNDPDAHNNRGVALFNLGRINEAVGHYIEAVRINPNHVNAVMNFGNALLQQGKIEEAAMQYKRVLQINPEDAGAHLNRAHILASQGKLNEAMTHFREAIKIKPDNEKALIGLGDVLAGQGQIEEAVAYYLKAAEIAPQNAELHYNTGTILASQGKLDEAMNHFREAIRIKPDYAKALNNIGSILMLKGDTEGAIERFREALRIQADYPMAQNNLNDALSLQRKK